MEQEELDEALGITRCARCGHRLNGEVECPFCSMFPGPERQEGVPKWIYLTACFLTSPLNLYAVIKSDRLTAGEKLLAFSGCLFWAGFLLF